jgi:hypothetical protein
MMNPKLGAPEEWHSQRRHVDAETDQRPDAAKGSEERLQWYPPRFRAGQHIT